MLASYCQTFNYLRSEANDLALRLAAAYTKKKDVLCFDG